MKLFDKLGDKVRDVRTINELCTGAEGVALREGAALPGAEHLLAAALALSEGSARRAFERVGADPDALPAAIAHQHTQALRAIGIEPVPDELLDPHDGQVTTPGKGVFRTTASFQRAFTTAGELARAGDGPLLGAHVVVAVAQIEYGTAPRALRAMGIDPAALAAAAREEANA